MKLLKIHYATIFLASLYTISSYGATGDVINGANINQSDNNDTILHHLIYRIKKTSDEKLLDLIKTALAQGADPLIKNNKDKTCFDIIQESKTYGSEPLESSVKGFRVYALISEQTLELLDKAECLLKGNLPPEKETKTYTNVHL